MREIEHSGCGNKKINTEEKQQQEINVVNTTRDSFLTEHFIRLSTAKRLKQ